MEHGIGEMLQGNAAPGGILINAIGPQVKSVWQGREPALAIIPNFFVTGVLAIIVSHIVILWAAAFVHLKQLVVQLLVGYPFCDTISPS